MFVEFERSLWNQPANEIWRGYHELSSFDQKKVGVNHLRLALSQLWMNELKPYCDRLPRLLRFMDKIVVP